MRLQVGVGLMEKGVCTPVYHIQLWTEEIPQIFHLSVF